ncbi:MAG: hypothetical protein KAW09_07600 [Thermoplasmata archaeon]|nr:hypothetical protein [Thermoplasmata archaeon]
MKSDIRTDDGGYKSEYDFVSKCYSSWGSGDDCSLSTAGAVLVLLRFGVHTRLAVESGENLINLIIDKSNSSLEGAMPAGQNSDIVNSYYQAISIQAFCELYRKLGEDRYIRAAVRCGVFALKNLQTSSGYLQSHLLITNNIRNKIRYGRMLCVETQTWLAEYVRTFHELYNITKAERWIKASDLLAKWLSAIQNPDGSFYKSRLSTLGRLLHAGRNLNLTTLINGWEKKIHPTGIASSLEAFVLSDRTNEARRTHEWLRENLSPYGLFLENYQKNGNSSVLDVMPSAKYGIILLKHMRHLPESEELVRRIAKGIVREQVLSEDENANGGIVGLPEDPKKGRSALGWDTEYGALFLAEILFPRQEESHGATQA